MAIPVNVGVADVVSLMTFRGEGGGAVVTSEERQHAELLDIGKENSGAEGELGPRMGSRLQCSPDVGSSKSLLKRRTGRSIRASRIICDGVHVRSIPLVGLERFTG